MKFLKAMKAQGKELQSKYAQYCILDRIVPSLISISKSIYRLCRNMMSPRATLATDSLNALRMMVSHIPPTSSANRSRRELREFLREALTTEQICSIVDLNRMINEALIESHVAMKAAQETSVSENASSTFFSASPSGSFRPYEKLLWYVLTESNGVSVFVCQPHSAFVGT